MQRMKREAVACPDYLIRAVHWKQRKDVPKGVYACGVFKKLFVYTENLGEVTCRNCLAHVKKSCGG